MAIAYDFEELRLSLDNLQIEYLNIRIFTLILHYEIDSIKPKNKKNVFELHPV